MADRDIDELPTPAPSCTGCKFSVAEWMDIDKHGIVQPTLQLECHRLPPVMLLPKSDADAPVVAWPQVDGGDWCGEYTPEPD